MGFKPTRGSAESGLDDPDDEQQSQASNPRGVRLKVSPSFESESGTSFKPTRGSAERWTDLDVQPHSTRTEQKTHEKLLDEYRTEPDPTEQSTLVTDGGQQMARPRTIYCRECNSIHPADAAHKPWGVTDE